MRVYRTITATDRGLGGTKWRGGQIIDVADDLLTVRLYLEINIIGTRTVARALAPAAILGDPVACQISGDSADSYVVVALAPTRFASVSGSNDSVTRGEFCAGRVPDSLSGETPYTPWWSGH